MRLINFRNSAFLICTFMNWWNISIYITNIWCFQIVPNLKPAFENTKRKNKSIFLINVRPLFLHTFLFCYCFFMLLSTYRSQCSVLAPFYNSDFIRLFLDFIHYNQWPNLKNLSGGLNLSRGLSMVVST